MMYSIRDDLGVGVGVGVGGVGGGNSGRVISTLFRLDVHEGGGGNVIITNVSLRFQLFPNSSFHDVLWTALSRSWKDYTVLRFQNIQCICQVKLSEDARGFHDGSLQMATFGARTRV